MTTMTLHDSDRANRLLHTLSGIAPLLKAEAEGSERLRRPTPAVQQALLDSGVFGLMIPAELGGMEATPLQILRVIEELSHTDASLGWLVGSLATETATAATYLSEEAITSLLGDGQHTLVAGQATAAPGSATRADGGLRVTGTWRFAPGVSMATHLNLSVVVDDTGDEATCIVARDQAFISDNWDVLGLRATASLDYAVDDLFVPDTQVMSVSSDNARRGGVVNRLSPALHSGLNQAAWSQGVGRRMLDELKRLAQLKGTDPRSALACDEFFEEYARHYSHVQGTWALLVDTWTANENTLREGGSLSSEQETMTRLACGLATRTSLEISRLVHLYAGAHVMHSGPLQRFFRDSHAGTQHRGTARDVISQCGRMLTGTLPESARWGFFEVTIPEDAS